ncbi:MAG: hypothetical protein IJ429_01945 [Lachnospiraceae bacterium]|nr:hypothetical protein [Lachnospiraceae bacterium]
MKQKHLSPITVLFLITLIACFSIVVYLIFTGNCDQRFTDIVVERTAYYQSNKSAEMTLSYGLIFIGIILLTFAFFKFCNPTALTLSHTYDFGYVLFLILCTVVTTQYILYTTLNPLHCLAVIIGLLLLLIDRSVLAHGLVFYYVSFYGICGVYRIYAALTDAPKNTSVYAISLISSVLTIATLMFKSRKTILYYGILFLQIPIPFLLMIYKMNTHYYYDNYLDIAVPQNAALFIHLLIICCLLFIAHTLYQNRENNFNVFSGKAISLGTCISIICASSFSTNGFVVPTDLHHPAENIIGYSQIFSLGQSAYTEYIPPSGLYSIVGGYFMRIFGNELMTNYNLCMNLLQIVTILIAILLLNAQIKREWLFVLSVLLLMTGTSRVLFILPIMFLLTIPKLLKHPKTWLCLWFFSTYLHGLYYPLYGAAVGLAFAPLGALQLYKAIKDFKTIPKSRVPFIACIITWICSIIAGAPILIGTLKHTLAMSGQTIYADGISIFGQTVPNNFLPQLNSSQDITFIRLALWNILRFMIPVIIVWIAFLILCSAFHIFKYKKTTISKEQLGLYCVPVIFPIISYSYGLVRMDNNALSIRAAYPIAYAIVFILLLLTQNSLNKYKVHLLLILFCISVLNGKNIDYTQHETLLKSYHPVSSDYLYINNPSYHMGTGFIAKNTYEALTASALSQRAGLLDRNETYFSVFPSFGYHYAYDIKGGSLIENVTVKGFEATQETVDLLRKQKVYVGRSFSAFENYYLYYYLMTSGEYLYNSELRLFVPCNQLSSPEETKYYNQAVDIAKENYDLGKYASSLGSSINSLMPIFNTCNLKYNIQQNKTEYCMSFKSAFTDKDFDFIYIDLSINPDNYTYTLFESGIEHELTSDRLATLLMKKNYNPDQDVVITYSDESGIEHNIRCALSKGKLLIPLGSGAQYLLNEHSAISIHLEYNDNIIQLPQINDIRLLKLREIE